MKRPRRIALPAAALIGDRLPARGPLCAELPQAAPPGGRDDFAARRAVLEQGGGFRPAPPGPPWADPRPDLVGDHARGLLVLDLAYHRDAADPEGVFGARYGARCCGAASAHLAEDWTRKPAGPPPGWRLARGAIPADDWRSQSWAAIRARRRLPQRAALVKILLGRTA